MVPTIPTVQLPEPLISDVESDLLDTEAAIPLVVVTVVNIFLEPGVVLVVVGLVVAVTDVVATAAVVPTHSLTYGNGLPPLGTYQRYNAALSRIQPLRYAKHFDR